MSEVFISARFGKRVWLTDHALAAMKKRRVTLAEVEVLIEQGDFLGNGKDDGWLFHRFAGRADNLVCAAVTNRQAIVVKTIMINWREREE